MRPRLALLATLLLILAACQSSASPGASNEGSASGNPEASSAGAPDGSAPGSGEPASSDGSGGGGGGATPPQVGGGGGGGGGSGVNCSSGSLSPNLSQTFSQADPSADFSQGFCVVSWTLNYPGEGASGTARVLAGNDVMLTIDMANYYSIGSPGSQEWVRQLSVSPPIGVVPGSTVRLDLGSCSFCDALEVTFGAASR
jgi:hypothetical protein